MKTVRASTGFTVLAAAALALAGCTNGGTSGGTATAAARDPAKPAAAPAPSPAPSVAKRPSLASKVAAPRDAAVITGWVVYQGTPPKPKAINFGPEKVCGNLHGDTPPMYETLVVNPNGTVKGALVAIRGRVPGTYPPPDRPVVVDQIGCIFAPHVVGMVAGQEIEFRNSDPVSHNIRGSPTRNLVFNSVFATKASARSKFDTPEIGIPLKCDIHFWMSGYVHVLPHPFFAITGDDGSFVISGVPPGNYTLLAWHETLKSQTQTVTVSAGEVKEVEFTWPGGN
jgi:plastocyanin